MSFENEKVLLHNKHIRKQSQYIEEAWTYSAHKILYIGRCVDIFELVSSVYVSAKGSTNSVLYIFVCLR